MFVLYISVSLVLRVAAGGTKHCAALALGDEL
jgi:hypothetical protein